MSAQEIIKNTYNVERPIIQVCLDLRGGSKQIHPGGAPPYSQVGAFALYTDVMKAIAQGPTSSQWPKPWFCLLITKVDDGGMQNYLFYDVP